MTLHQIELVPMTKKALFQLLVGNNDVAVKQVEQYDGCCTNTTDYVHANTEIS